MLAARVDLARPYETQLRAADMPDDSLPLGASASLPRSRDDLAAITIEQNGQIVRLMGALGDLVDAVEDGTETATAISRAKKVLGRDI